MASAIRVAKSTPKPFRRSVSFNPSYLTCICAFYIFIKNYIGVL